MTSPPELQPPLTQAELDEAALREAMVEGEGVRRLGRLIPLDSLDRNLVEEDAAFARKMNGKKGASSAADDDMRILAARDVKIVYGNEQQPTPDTKPADPAKTDPETPATPPKEPAKTDPATTTTTTTVAKKTSWWPAAVVAASLIGGASAGYVANALAPKPTRDTDTDTTTVLDFPTERK